MKKVALGSFGFVMLSLLGGTIFANYQLYQQSEEIQIIKGVLLQKQDSIKEDKRTKTQINGILKRLNTHGESLSEQSNRITEQSKQIAEHSLLLNEQEQKIENLENSKPQEISADSSSSQNVVDMPVLPSIQIPSSQKAYSK